MSFVDDAMKQRVKLRSDKSHSQNNIFLEPNKKKNTLKIPNNIL